MVHTETPKIVHSVTLPYTTLTSVCWLLIWLIQNNAMVSCQKESKKTVCLQKLLKGLSLIYNNAVSAWTCLLM